MKRNFEKFKNYSKIIIRTIAGVIIGLIFSFPIIWLIFTSFKPNSEILGKIPTFVPSHWTIEHYINLIRMTRFELYFLNSVFVSVIATALGITVAVFTVYSLSRFKFKFNSAINMLLLVSYMLPEILIIVAMMIAGSW